MSLISAQPRLERDKVSFRLDRATLNTLRQYAEWLDSSQEWIVNRALEHLFQRDRDFQRWRSEQQGSGAPATRSRRRTRAKEGEA